MKIEYIPSEYLVNTSEISFDILKRDVVIKRVKIKLLLYTVNLDLYKLEKQDTIKIDKSVNCLKNNYIYLPHYGTTTCVKINNEEKIYFERCYTTEEQILINIEELPIGNYSFTYIGEFYKLDKQLKIY